MDREAVTQRILENKRRLNLTWAEIARAVGKSEAWVAAGCLGQATFSPQEATRLGSLLQMEDDEVEPLTVIPHRGDTMDVPPRDPTLYRLYEIVLVYGETIKELVHEKFGDGIMSAIDFTMDIDRIPDPAGDRVQVTMSGKFLPYKTW